MAGRATKNEEYWVAPAAVVLGKVRLEAEASIWWALCFGATTSSSPWAATATCRTTACPGYPLIIGPNAAVGHLAMLPWVHDRRVPSSGIGAVILNGGGSAAIA
jgi:carbonic anhydrase/acetyltransferase-like protein (isoleucine patch superfamily)